MGPKSSQHSGRCNSESAGDGLPSRAVQPAPRGDLAWQARAVLLALAALLTTAPGCTVWQNMRRTIIHEPIVYSWKHDKKRSLETYRAWADQAWSEHFALYPEVCSNDDYALGFRDGFVDYVYAGGNGEPPPVPPRHFWNVEYRNGDGHAAAAQWFAGYRHGAAVARDGGYRAQATLRSSLRLGPYHQANDYQYDSAPSPYLQGQPTPAPAEPVPPPTAESLVNPYRELPDADGNGYPEAEPDRLPKQDAPQSTQPPVTPSRPSPPESAAPALESTPPPAELESPAIDVEPFPIVPEFEEPESTDDPNDVDPFGIGVQRRAPGAMRATVQTKDARPTTSDRDASVVSPVLPTRESPVAEASDRFGSSDHSAAAKHQPRLSQSLNTTPYFNAKPEAFELDNFDLNGPERQSTSSPQDNRATSSHSTTSSEPRAVQTPAAHSPEQSMQINRTPQRIGREAALQGPVAPREDTLLFPDAATPRPRAYAVSIDRVDAPRRDVEAATIPANGVGVARRRSGDDPSWQFVR